MKKILVCAAMLALFAAPALAQPNGDHHEGERGSLHPGGAHATGNTNHANPGGHAPTPPAAPRAAPRAAPQANSNTMMRNDRGNDHRGPGNNMRGPNNGVHGPSGNASRNYGVGGSRRNMANFNQFRRNFTSPRRYRAPQRYIRPQGWYAHRWTYGERLPPAFFLRNYWISNFFDYGLINPPYGTTWVRYGADAVLVDEETGEVIQVAYGVFY